MIEQEVWTLIEPVLVYRRMGSVTGVQFNEQMLLEAGTRVMVVVDRGGTDVDS